MPNGPDSPETKGRWLGPVRAPGYSAGSPDARDGAFGVHATLLHTGRVLFFSGYFESQGYPYRSWEFDPARVVDAIEGDDTEVDDIYRDDVLGRWFLPGFEGEEEGPSVADDPDIDLFCSHHVALEDGRILVVGGDAVADGRGHDNRGLHIYDPRTHRWTDVPHRMAAGRWYPTAVTMPDGRAAIFSGDSEPTRVDRDDLHFHEQANGHGHHEGSDIFGDVEVVGSRSFNPTIVQGSDKLLYIYPGLVLVKGRKVYYVPTAWRYESLDEESLRNALETEFFQFTGDDSGSWTAPNPEPLLPVNPYREEGAFVLLPPAREGRILVVGGRGAPVATDNDPESCEILETQHTPVRWIPAGRMHHERVNVSTVLLPNGKVLIIGGHDGSSGKLIPEIYDPSVEFDPDTYTPTEGDPTDPAKGPTAPFTEVAEMEMPRMYHSTALLLPDGRVLTAGGYGEPRHGGGEKDQREMEIYEPPYLHQGPQPEILSVSVEDSRSKEIRYGESLIIDYEVADGARIEMVALMRPGSITHHTDTEQRYEDLEVLKEDETLRARIPADPSILPPGYYMLWIVDDEGRPCKEAEFVRLSQRACTLVTDRSHFSASAYRAVANEGDTAEFGNALYVILHGFVPREIGIHTADPTRTQIDGFAPDVSPIDEDGGPVLGIAADATDMFLEHPEDDLDVRQRITFEYSILIGDADLFPTSDGEETAERLIGLRTMVEGFTCEGQISLVSAPNPYMLDGDPHWLSTDLRVFQVRDGESVSGVTLDTDEEPLAYLQEFLEQCRATDDGPGNPFSMLPTNMEEARLELAPRVDGDRVLNFTIARVRLQAPRDVTASNVHVFFRLFVTQQPTLPYHVQAFPRSDGSPAYAQVGKTPGEIITIPFYGTPRSDVSSPPYDDLNIQYLRGEGDREAIYYFGAWLDINDTSVTLTDPSDGESRTLQQLIRGRHQCMVSEIFFEDDEIPLDATPATSDNLSQRNLAIVHSDNPGGPDAHTVLHTFNVGPTWAKLMFEQEIREFGTAHMLARPRFLKEEPVEAKPDELAIFWRDVPREAEATLYLPALDADEIVELARLEGRAGVLEKAGPHTVKCPVADVSYVPLPALNRDDLACMISVKMPGLVEIGQRYRVVVRHYSRMKGRIEGSFELLIPVNEPSTFRDETVRELALFRHIARSLPDGNRWRPIFERYLDGLASRVRGLGVDPTHVAPSPAGEVRITPPTPQERLCWLLTCLLEKEGFRQFLSQKGVSVDVIEACVKAYCADMQPSPGDRVTKVRPEVAEVFDDPCLRQGLRDLLEVIEHHD